MPEVVILFLRGFLLSAGLIVAIGGQNAFVLRLGLQQRFVLPAVLFCAGSDAALIFAGGMGFGSLVAASPVLLTLIGVVGSLFLVTYGAYAAYRALRPESLKVSQGDLPGFGATMATLAAFTWANPHVYLDTVLLIGGLAGRIPLPDRYAFLMGGALASLSWFTLLGFGARFAIPLFAKPIAWRILDGIIALTMWLLALNLGLEIFGINVATQP
jgi:L-lysine exporter family protein LysE/ArgO